VGKWILSSLTWGLGIGVAGAIFLLLMGSIHLAEVPWFVGTWVLLGVLAGIALGSVYRTNANR
jgi:hypothetical protein